MAERNFDFGILVIDDNTEIHHDFIKILTKTTSAVDEISNQLFGSSKIDTNAPNIALPHFKIDTATQGQEGVKRIGQAIKENNPYALAFVDIRMPPGWDGVETIKHIWELDKDIQVVICTAYSDYTWEETIAKLGQSDNLLILKKPFDFIAVRQLACALTQKWKLMQESRCYTKSLEKTVQIRTEELHRQATHDSLTELPNRALLHDRMQQAIATSNRSKKPFALLFFDLDRFKLINDSLGHLAGDELLCSIAQRLQSTMRAGDTLARLGGDEFVLIANELTSEDSAATIASVILNATKQPFQIQGRNLIVTTSIGICIYPKDATKIDDLLRNADIAMYRAKEAGADQFKFYLEEMNKECLDSFELELELHEALKKNQFCLYYQPQYDTTNNKVEAVEALVRWDHPTRGLLLPIDFISVAEKTGLITSIGEWVLREACKQAKIWQNQKLGKIRVAVNVTSQQVRQFNFVEIVKNILDAEKLSPEFLELELSENIIINNVSIIKTINSLKELGIQISIDDFGTGYSSLNYLRNIPLDRLKIDKSFVQNIKLNHGDEVIIHAIISMAKSLNLDVLAEGVENQNQLDFLKTQECNSIQGYYFTKPLSSVDLTNLLKNPSLLNKEKYIPLK